MEFLLGEDRATLLRLADWKPNYAPFQLTKRPKPHSLAPVSPSSRRIDNPAEHLKRVQTKILRRLLIPVELPDFVFGAVPERSVVGHASRHLGATTVVKMDIQSFYPSITNRHVHKVWSDVLGCSPGIAYLLTRLTTCNFYLPQGAPTSPAIANLLLASFYGPVVKACLEKDVILTVWVDDLTFSGTRAREVIEAVRQALAANGFKPSRKKLFILGQRDAKHVTGPRLGRGKVRACRKMMGEVRAGIFNLQRGKYTSRGHDKDLESVQGKIAHIRFVCPADAQKLEVQLLQATVSTVR